MMKRVMILGGKGNMGRRYTAICRYLGIEPLIIDIDSPDHEREKAVSWSDGYIIATPTRQHGWDVKSLSARGKPILCEKPLSKSLDTVEKCLAFCRSRNTPLAMVNQYRFLTEIRDEGDTLYDYWNHGRDGLAWDLISVIGLAKGGIHLAEESPFWRCVINGRILSLADMDQAYVDMIDHWAKDPHDQTDYIRAAHQKTWELDKEYGRKTR